MIYFTLFLDFVNQKIGFLVKIDKIFEDFDALCRLFKLFFDFHVNFHQKFLTFFLALGLAFLLVSVYNKKGFPPLGILIVFPPLFIF